MQQYEERKPSKWMKQIKSYMKAVNINLYNIEHIQNNEIKKRVQDIDNSLWNRVGKKPGFFVINRKNPVFWFKPGFFGFYGFYGFFSVCIFL